MTLRMTLQRLFASIALVFLPLTAWSKDATVVALAGGAIAVSLAPGVLTQVRRSLSMRNPTVLFGALFCGWMAVSLIWAPVLALSALAKAYAVFALAVVLGVGIAQLAPAQRSALVKPLATSFGALLVILVIERVTGGFFISLDRSSETPEQLLNAMNGGLVMIASLTFCAAAAMYRTTGQRALLLVLFVLTLTLTYRMNAVPLALLAGAVAAAAAVCIGHRAVVGLFVVVGGGVLLWPVAAWLAAESGLHFWVAENVYPNWGHRIAIWGAVSELIAGKSLLGYGFNGARIVGQTADLMPDPQGRTSFLHPHNGLLQIWLELGAIGVALLYAATIAAARTVLNRLRDTTVLAAAAGTFAAMLTIWLLSFGVWQSWWMSVLGLAIAAVVFVGGTTQHYKRGPAED